MKYKTCYKCGNTQLIPTTFYDGICGTQYLYTCSNCGAVIFPKAKSSFSFDNPPKVNNNVNLKKK